MNLFNCRLFGCCIGRKASSVSEPGPEVLQVEHAQCSNDSRSWVTMDSLGSAQISPGSWSCTCSFEAQSNPGSWSSTSPVGVSRPEPISTAAPPPTPSSESPGPASEPPRPSCQCNLCDGGHVINFIISKYRPHTHQK